MTDRKEVFDHIYKQTNSLQIATNSLLVLDGKRTAFLIESDQHIVKTLGMDAIVKIINRYLKSIDTPYGLIVHKKDREIDFDKIKTDKDLGELLSYPCAGDAINFENRKFTYTVIVKYKNETIDQVRWKLENLLMAVICIKKSDKIFKKLVENFQKSINNIDSQLEIVYVKDRIGNMTKIIQKLENKKKLKEYEKEYILSIFIQDKLALINDCYENKHINIFKKKKFLLTMIYYWKYNIANNECLDLNDIVLFQKNVIKIHLGINYDDKEINEIFSWYLDKEFKLRDKIEK